MFSGSLPNSHFNDTQLSSFGPVRRQGFVEALQRSPGGGLITSTPVSLTYLERRFAHSASIRSDQQSTCSLMLNGLLKSLLADRVDILLHEWTQSVVVSECK